MRRALIEWTPAGQCIHGRGPMRVLIIRRHGGFPINASSFLGFVFVFVVNNPTTTQGGRKTQHANLSQRSIKKELPLLTSIQTHTRAGQPKTKTTKEPLVHRQQFLRHRHQRKPFTQQTQRIFDQSGTDPPTPKTLVNIQGANLSFRRSSLENAKPRQLTVYTG